MFVQSAIVIEGRQAFTVGAASQSNALEAGSYDVWGAADAYIRVGGTDAENVTSSDGYLVRAGQTITVRVGRNGLRIGSTAEISVHRVE